MIYLIFVCRYFRRRREEGSRSQTVASRIVVGINFFNVSALTTRITAELHDLLSLENLDKNSIWQAMVLDFSCTPWVDATAATELINTISSVQNHHGYPIVLCHRNAQCMETLLKSGMREDSVPSKRIFHSVHDAARAIALGRVTLGEEKIADSAPAGTQPT